jgi:neutral ceramidase
MRAQKWWNGVLLPVVSGLLVSGCAEISGSLPDTPEPAPTGSFLVGAANVDITPVPGYPMGGHSKAGKFSRGHWLRLRARAIVMEDASGRRLALVSADLWAVPGGLTDRVLELIGRKNSSCRIGTDSLVLAATHTHQSPGNYSSSSAYDFLASPGYFHDPEMFDFLAARIATAVQSACGNREPARLYWDRVDKVRCLFRNRSSVPFLENGADAQAILNANEDLWQQDCRKGNATEIDYKAVNPSIVVLSARAQSEAGRLIAVAAFLAVHPTSMSNLTEVYSSDLFGFAATSTEQRLRRTNPGQHQPVVALFNGAEGDVSANWDTQDRRDVASLGLRLSEEITSAISTRNQVIGRIDGAQTRAPLAGRCARFDSSQCTDGQGIVGVGMMGGAEDGRSCYYEKGCVEGIRRIQPEGLQGTKSPFWEPQAGRCFWDYWFFRTVGSFLWSPTEVPLAIHRIGPVALVTLPGEFTTAMGYRIVNAVSHALSAHRDRVVLVGLANEYVSYFTTPEEYALQHYEGASTLYGTHSANVIRDEIVFLAGRLARDETDVPTKREYSYRGGWPGGYQPSDRPVSPGNPAAALDNILLGESTNRFCWRAETADLRQTRINQWRATPNVSIEIQNAGAWGPFMFEGTSEDDDGTRFVTVLAADADSEPMWCSFWMRPPVSASTRLLRFAVVNQDGSTVHSDMFRID